jgi:hypothetical protein
MDDHDFFTADDIDEVKNPVAARLYALNKLEGVLRGEYKYFFCDMCRRLMPCDCDEPSENEIATQAKYDAHNAVIDELLVVVERMRGS